MAGTTSGTSESRSGSRRLLTRYLDDARRVVSRHDAAAHGERPNGRKRRARPGNGALSKDRVRELVEPHLFYVVQVASEFQSREIPLEELLAEGNMGLVEAAHRYDPAHEVKFLTYASWWIRKRILEYLSREGKSVRLTRYARERRRDIRTAAEKLRARLQREPTVEEVAEECDLDVETVLRRAATTPRVLSLEHVVRPETGTTLGDTLADDEGLSVEEVIQQRRMSGVVRREVARLPDRERTIIRNRFGLDGSEAMTFEQLGRILGLSRERTRQIEREALVRLRRRLSCRRTKSLPSSAPR